MLSEMAIQSVVQQGLSLFLNGLPCHLPTMKLSSQTFAANVCECPCLLKSPLQRWGSILEFCRAEMGTDSDKSLAIRKSSSGTGRNNPEQGEWGC